MNSFNQSEKLTFFSKKATFKLCPKKKENLVNFFKFAY